jgi:hypothetical protein
MGCGLRHGWPSHAVRVGASQVVRVWPSQVVSVWASQALRVTWLAIRDVEGRAAPGQVTKGSLRELTVVASCVVSSLKELARLGRSTL